MGISFLSPPPSLPHPSLFPIWVFLHFGDVNPIYFFLLFPGSIMTRTFTTVHTTDTTYYILPSYQIIISLSCSVTNGMFHRRVTIGYS